MICKEISIHAQRVNYIKYLENKDNTTKGTYIKY